MVQTSKDGNTKGVVTRLISMRCIYCASLFLVQYRIYFDTMIIYEMKKWSITDE